MHTKLTIESLFPEDPSVAEILSLFRKEKINAPLQIIVCWMFGFALTNEG
jgi:hypothetical protein